VVATDGSQLVAFTGTNTFYFLQVNPNGTFSNRHQVTANVGQIFNNGHYYGSNLWFMRDQSTNILYGFDTSTVAWYNTSLVVTDYCVTTGEVLYTVTVNNGTYTLTAPNV
jgi:hypothetical protein